MQHVQDNLHTEVDSSSEEDSLFTDSDTDPFADLDSDDEGPPDQEPVSYSKL